jgi:hypothetical protein
MSELTHVLADLDEEKAKKLVCENSPLIVLMNTLEPRTIWVKLHLRRT